jgi:hypothetical protein
MSFSVAPTGPVGTPGRNGKVKDRWRSKLAHQIALCDGIRLDTLHDARAFVVATPRTKRNGTL